MPPDMPAVKILYEDENFLAVDKPAGLMVHAAKHKKPRPGIPEPETLVDWLLKKYPEIKTVGDDPAFRPGIVHRLDKETSGVMLVAKNQPYFEYLKSLFQNHLVKKTYYAVVLGEPKAKQGTIDAPIGIVNGTLKRSVRSAKMRKEAVTEYRVVKTLREPANGSSETTSKPWVLLEVHPKTGRTHQIRVHLASIGHPIVGDALYGNSAKKTGKKNPVTQTDRRLMLHASAIAFPQRHGATITIESGLPEAFRK